VPVGPVAAFAEEPAKNIMPDSPIMATKAAIRLRLLDMRALNW